MRLRLFEDHAVTVDRWLDGIGFAIVMAGLALAVWARVALGRNWGMPMSTKVDPVMEERSMSELCPDTYPDDTRSTEMPIPFVL